MAGLRRLFIPSVAVTAGVAALAAILVASAADQAVTVQGFAFQPASLTVNVGDTVTWTNKDGVAHTVTADGGSFDKPLAAGGTATITFSQPGTFAYHCTIHPSMKASVVVQAAGAATARPAAAPSTGSGVAPASSTAPLFIVLGGVLLAVAVGAGALAMESRR